MPTVGERTLERFPVIVRSEIDPEFRECHLKNEHG